VIVKPIWIFAIDRKVQLEVGQTEFGVYFALLNLSIVFSFLLDLGFTNYFNRQLAFHKENFIQFAGNFLLLKVFLVFVYSAVLILTAWLSGVQRWDIIISLILIQVLMSFFLFFRSIITARQWFKTDVWLSVLDKILLIILCGSLLYFPMIFETITIDKFLFFQLGCTGLAAITALGILLRRGVSFNIGSSSIFNKAIWRDALPFGIVVFLMAMHYRLDGFLLERLKGPAESGLYAAAYRLLDAGNMVGYLFASFLLPYLARQWSDSKEINTVVHNTRHALILYSIFITSAVIFLSGWLGKLIYEDKIDNIAVILAWLMSALIGCSLVQIYGTVLTATGHIKQFCMITVLAVALNIILNLILIPGSGAKGACWSAVISQAFFGFSTMIYCRYKLGIHFHFRSFILYLTAAAVLSLLYVTGKNLSINNWVLLAAAGMLTLLFLLLIKPGMWKYWLKLKTSVT
jgi:O-antigen/teichoic acid export membrane protein